MTICEQITELFPVRKTAAQKKAFRQWVMGEISRMGYRARVEENDNGRQRNIVVGDPEHAQVIFTAHYDTPSTILLPDLQIPRNFPVYLLWQLLIIGGMLLISLAAGVGLGLLTGSGDVMILTFFGAFLVLMWLQIGGFANKNNVNDNTSGVAALLETMARIPEENRAKAAFILFDNMEKGRRGSKAWARDHLEVQHTQYVLFEKLMTTIPGKTCRCHSSVTTRGSSDFRSFKCGVGVTAYREVSGVGLYLGDLHTSRDTEADQGNIAGLAEAFSSLVEQL